MTSPTPQELTTAPSRYLRSVRLESDLHAAQAPAGYVITPQVRLVLRRILTALKVEGADRALTLTGPYGTGKSAFALYLSRLVNDPKGDAFRLLQKVDPALAHEVSEVVPRPLLPVPLTLRRARLSTLLMEGLARAASTFGEGKTLAQRLEQDLLATEDGFDSQTVLRAIDELKAAAVAVSEALEASEMMLERGHLAGLWFLRARARRAENGAGRRVDLTFRARIDLG